MEIATEVVLETVNEVPMELSLILSWKLSLKFPWKLLFSLKSVSEIVGYDCALSDEHLGM